MKTKKGYIIIMLIVLIILFWIYYEKYINVRPKQQLLVLRNYNPEAGLHWMGVYNVIKAAHEALKRNLKLVVIMDSGLYLERDNRFIEQYKDHIDKDNNEWFSYYFEPLGIDDPEINKLWKSGQLNNLPSLTKYNWRKNVIGYEFDRDSLNNADRDINFKQNWDEVIRPKSYIKNQINDFYNERMKDKFLIGIHVRGTDKYKGYKSSEDNPKHFTYDQYCKAIEKEIDLQKNKGNKNIAVFACSDEQPFIDYITNYFRGKCEVIHTGNRVLRSNVNTSGLEFDSEFCDQYKDHPDCRFYKELIENSIHRGMKNQSNYKKGWDAVFEVCLLAKCDVFYKSRGNFSNSVVYANPNAKIVDMVSTIN